MACYHPLLAFRSEGKITFNKPFPYAKGLNLPCGQCVGCRLNYSRQWAIRLVHENQMHDHSCFITLTFSPEELNKRGNPDSLDVRDFQLFMKRLRKKHPEKTIRFFHCGEYGEKNQRPHYHALIYNHDFSDRKLFKERKNIKLYTSKELEQLWPYGFSTIGDVTFQSAAYVARYIMKKQKGDTAKQHYSNIDTLTGEVTTIEPEYCTMSRKPGIGYNWFKKYKTDVYPRDVCIINNHEVKPPRYYDTLLTEEELKEVKQKRKEQMDKPYDGYDERLDRLWVQEEVKIQTLKLLIRNL
jgi:hypothetical protein